MNAIVPVETYAFGLSFLEAWWLDLEADRCDYHAMMKRVGAAMQRQLDRHRIDPLDEVRAEMLSLEIPSQFLDETGASNYPSACLTWSAWRETIRHDDALDPGRSRRRYFHP